MISPFPQSRQFNHHMDYLYLRSISPLREPIDEWCFNQRVLNFKFRHRGRDRGPGVQEAAGSSLRVQWPVCYSSSSCPAIGRRCSTANMLLPRYQRPFSPSLSLLPSSVRVVSELCLQLTLSRLRCPRPCRRCCSAGSRSEALWFSVHLSIALA